MVKKKTELEKIREAEQTEVDVSGDWFLDAYGINLRINKKTVYKDGWFGFKEDYTRCFLEYFDEEAKAWKPLPVFTTSEYPWDREEEALDVLRG